MGRRGQDRGQGGVIALGVAHYASMYSYLVLANRTTWVARLTASIKLTLASGRSNVLKSCRAHLGACVLDIQDHVPCPRHNRPRGSVHLHLCGAAAR